MTLSLLNNQTGQIVVLYYVLQKKTKKKKKNYGTNRPDGKSFVVLCPILIYSLLLQLLNCVSFYAEFALMIVVVRIVQLKCFKVEVKDDHATACGLLQSRSADQLIKNIKLFPEYILVEDTDDDNDKLCHS